VFRDSSCGWLVGFGFVGFGFVGFVGFGFVWLVGFVFVSAIIFNQIYQFL
jgi:hypothetical protein